MNIKHIGCKVEGCTKKHRSNGYCTRHESQLRRRGYIFGNPVRGKKGGNEFYVDGDTTRMMIYNNDGGVIAKCIIDTEDIDRCQEHQWSMNGQGYVSSKIDGRYTDLHRFLLGITEHEVNVDHINRTKLDNRKCNFRLCVKSQNVLNVGLRKDNASGYKGVYFHKEWRKWESHIDINNKRVHIGSFKTAEEAALAYNEASKRYHGEFGYINPVVR